jgi:hypothetical protein
MKLIIAGSRSFTDTDLLTLECLNFIGNVRHPVIISGAAGGADTLGIAFAHAHSFRVRVMPAQWRLYGKSAGYRRNEEMAKIATHCICFWDGESRGTQHMIDIARRYNLELRVVMF